MDMFKTRPSVLILKGTYKIRTHLIIIDNYGLGELRQDILICKEATMCSYRIHRYPQLHTQSLMKVIELVPSAIPKSLTNWVVYPNSVDKFYPSEIVGLHR